MDECDICVLHEDQYPEASPVNSPPKVQNLSPQHVVIDTEKGFGASQQ